MGPPLIDAVRARSARAGVIGIGYVGLPLLLELVEAGFEAIGIDIDEKRIAALNRGESYVTDVTDTEVQAALATSRFEATSDFGALSRVDTVNICVPTPLLKTRDPDLSCIAAAVDEVARHLRAGQLIIIESTTWPGAVEEFVRPRLEQGGLRAGRDFWLAFSPERIDPGNKEWPLPDIPKVVGGIDPESGRIAVAFYEQIVKTVVPVSSTRVAEMVKLIENTFRAVNIGLANEIALMCRSLDVDVWEAIDAACTKPFGFMPFYPGPGLGGHCLPVDPFYLSWKARQDGFESRFIDLAGYVNASMPRHVLQRVVDALNSCDMAISGSHVHIVGIAYKPGVGDTRESPALDIAALLLERGAEVSYSDPFATATEIPRLEQRPLDEALAGGIDCAVIATHHPGVDYDSIVRQVPVVVDTRNALRGFDAEHIFRI